MFTLVRIIKELLNKIRNIIIAMLECDQHESGNLIQQLKLPYILAFKCSLSIDTFSTKMVALTTMGLLVSKFTAYERECILTLERI